MRGESFHSRTESPTRRPKAARVEKRTGVKGREAPARGAANERNAEAEMQALLRSIHRDAEYLRSTGFDLTVPKDQPKKRNRR